jgi:hypothetical protein
VYWEKRKRICSQTSFGEDNNRNIVFNTKTIAVYESWEVWSSGTIRQRTGRNGGS